MTRVAIYRRLSIYDGPDDPSTSPERQLSECEELCTRMGWVVAMREEDLDVSASKNDFPDRPRSALILAQFSNIDVVVFSRMDRGFRNLRDYVNTAALAQKHNVKLWAVKEGELTGLPGQMFAMFAEYEASVISARVKGSIRHLKSVGRWKGGKTPYGYDSVPNPNGNGFILSPNPDETAIILKAAYFVVYKNLTLHSTAKELNNAGFRTRAGKLFDDTILNRVLTGPTIRGFVATAEGLVTGPDGLPKPTWEPIIDQETGVQLDSLLKPHAPKPVNGIPRVRQETLLSGLVSCGLCGANLHHRASQERYECPQAGCGKTVIRRAVLEEIALPLAQVRYPRIILKLPPPATPPDLHHHNQAIVRLTAEMAKPGADVMALAHRLVEAQALRTEAADQVLLSERFKIVADWQHSPYLRTILEAVLRVSVVPCGRGKRHSEETVSIQFLSGDGIVTSRDLGDWVRPEVEHSDLDLTGTGLGDPS